MILRGIDFGSVLDASGVRGFFGEGYWYHRWIPGLDFSDSTFVAKTTTLRARPGNMPLKKDGISPKELKPKCVVVKAAKGVALNAVGLSGPGAKALFETGRWQARMEPFFLSFMAVEDSLSKRLDELNGFIDLCLKHLPSFKAPIGLQLNVSCPNAGYRADDMVYETILMLAHAARLGVALMPKINALLPTEAALQIGRHPRCDALCVSNTIPWGQRSDAIPWEKLFGSKESPLKHLGGGGLSGTPLLPIVADWIRRARAAGFGKPINAGGGILGTEDVAVMKNAGADSVFLGSIAMLRGWRVRRTIRAARGLFEPEGGTRDDRNHHPQAG